MFSLKIEREYSGMEGTYPTFEDALARLATYSSDFPGEVVKAEITKIR